MTPSPGGQDRRAPKERSPKDPPRDGALRPAVPAAGDPPPRRVRWHDSLRDIATALLVAGAARVRRVHVFQLPPGVLGGLYAASFYDQAGFLHRCMTPYSDPALLARSLRSLRDALATLALPVIEGRIELGRHTGDVLHYFLPSAEPWEQHGPAEEKRAAAERSWLQAARDTPGGSPVLRQVEAEGAGTVLCASAADQHFLIRLDPRDDAALERIRAHLGATPASKLRSGDPLCGDIMGDWQGG